MTTDLGLDVYDFRISLKTSNMKIFPFLMTLREYFAKIVMYPPQ